MRQLDRGATIRVGVTVLVALGVLATAIFLVGSQDLLFTPTSTYFIHFENVGGLSEDNPVQLSGVRVGKVDRIILPENAEEIHLEVWISVERRYSSRIRADSLARIQTLGLLGDKFIAISSGSGDQPLIEPGHEIPAAPTSDVERLLASSGDAVDNLVASAGSLSRLLAKMEAGEGLLGQLLMEGDDGTRLLDTVDSALSSIDRIAASVEEGQGTIGRLVGDEALADSLTTAAERLNSILESVEEGDGLLPSLLSDPSTRDRFDTLLGNLETTTGNLQSLSEEIGSGDGLLPRLLRDEEFGEQITRELGELLDGLNRVVGKLDEGDGTAAKLLNDPAVFEALDDILVGVNESKLLRWLIRNRQKQGIKKRYKEESADLSAASPAP